MCDLHDLYDLYDLYDVAHVAGWELYNLHDLGHVSWVGSALYRSCTTSHNGRLGSTVDDLDRDLSDLSEVCNHCIVGTPYQPLLYNAFG